MEDSPVWLSPQDSYMFGEVIKMVKKSNGFRFPNKLLGRIGLPATKENNLVPVLIPLKFTVKQVSCGNWHSLLLTTEGKVYGTGHNKCGELGMPGSEDHFGFTLNSSLEGEHLVCLAPIHFIISYIEGRVRRFIFFVS